MTSSLLVQMADQVWQPGIAERQLERAVAVPVRAVGVTQHFAESGDRQVRPLRQEQHALAVRHRQRPRPIRPDAGERAEQRALSGARRTTHHDVIAGVDRNRDVVQDAPPVGQG